MAFINLTWGGGLKGVKAMWLPSVLPREKIFEVLGSCGCYQPYLGGGLGGLGGVGVVPSPTSDKCWEV